jgi:hypothetical protein
LIRGFLSAGDHRVSWDGRDENARWVASGVYFCRLEGGGRTLSRRLVAIH